MIHLYIINEGSRAANYGIGTFIKQLTACVVSRNDIDLTIIQLAAEKKRIVVETENGIRFIFCPSMPIPTTKLRNKYYKNIWYIIRQYIKCEETDKLIFHLNYGQEYPLIKKMKEDFPKCKVIFTIHYEEWAFALNGDLEKFKTIIHSEESSITDEKEKYIYKSFQEKKQLFSEADKIISLGDYAKPLLMNEYKADERKIIRIYNGLEDIAVVLSEEEKIDKKRSYGFSPNEKIVLYVGRLDEIKNVEGLIKSFGRVLPLYPDCRLVIVGDGDYSKCMQSAYGIWGKVTFIGKLEKNEVYKFYQIADIGVVPSLYEPFGLVAIEFMMHGVPVVVSDTSGLSEIVEDGISGLKVPVIEIEEKMQVEEQILENHISYLLKNNDVAREFGKNARQRFLEKFEIKYFKENYINIYLSL